MDIDIHEDITEENIQISRSTMMDNKIQEREKQNKTNDLKEEQKKKHLELKRMKEKEEEHEKSVKNHKQRKQKIKDARRKKNKSLKGQRNSLKKTKLFKIPNLKNVPDNCKHLVKEGDLIYVVPGDGCCGPNCGAAFLFQDEVFGT